MKIRVRTAVQVAHGLHSKVCIVRSIYRLVESVEFQTMFDTANEQQQDDALLLIERHDKQGLATWLKDQLRNGPLEGLNMRELRQLGQTLGVIHYQTLTKNQLITSIKAIQHGPESTCGENTTGT